jgi:hypothetical protein
MVGEGDLLDTASSKILVAVVFVVAAPISVAAVKLSTVYAVVEEAYVEKAYLVDGFIPKKITPARDILGLHGGETFYCRFTPPPQTLAAGQAALAPFTGNGESCPTIPTLKRVRVSTKGQGRSMFHQGIPLWFYHVDSTYKVSNRVFSRCINYL